MTSRVVLVGWLVDEGMLVKGEENIVEETEEEDIGIFSLNLDGATFAAAGDSVEAGDSLKPEDR